MSDQVTPLKTWLSMCRNTARLAPEHMHKTVNHVPLGLHAIRGSRIPAPVKATREATRRPVFLHVLYTTPIASRDFAESLLVPHSESDTHDFKQANAQLSSLMGTFFRVNMKLTKKIKRFS